VVLNLAHGKIKRPIRPLENTERVCVHFHPVKTGIENGFVSFYVPIPIGCERPPMEKSL
jgi:hypothetical protein